MLSTRFTRYLVGAIALAVILGALACGRDGPDRMVTVAQRDAQLDVLARQAGTAGLDGPRRTTLSYEAWLHSGDGD